MSLNSLIKPEIFLNMTMHIGCSGWHYLAWVGDFYPAGTKPAEFLKLYLNHFDTVEINNSFYRLPTEHALISWRDTVPPGFIFSVKASRYITHNKKLKDADESFPIFFDRIKLLNDRLGPILFQLPPKWSYNKARLEEFLTRIPPKNNYVFEFRNPAWICEDTFALLNKYNAGFCIHDMPGSVSPEVVTGKIAYLRFHGSEKKYGGSYSDKTLSEWAEKLVAWNKNNIEVFVYFNNDIGGFAPRNALTLKHMISEIE